MITITEIVEIHAPYEELYNWVARLDEEFVPWSPYHKSFTLLDGGRNVGDRLNFSEIVEGLTYDVSGVIVENRRDDGSFLFAFRNDKNTAYITFKGRKTPKGCQLTHVEEFGIRNRIIGPIINFLIFNVLYKKKANWKLVRDDMIRDNLYIKQILEEGVYPEHLSEASLEGKTV